MDCFPYKKKEEMLQKLQIRNFQSHDHTDLKFSPGITILVGSSDAGKSAILRALSWVIKNRPSGTSFIRQGKPEGEPCLVSLSLSNGATIIRSRHKSMNHYELKANGDSQIFAAIGSGVPEEITDVINMSDINIHRQLDGPFLILESPGAVAKAINEATKLDGVSKLTSWVSTAKRRAHDKANLLKEQLAQVEDSLKKYKTLDVMEPLLTQYTEFTERYEKLKRQQESLLEITNNLKEVEGELAVASPPASLGDVCDEMNQLLVGRKQVSSDYEFISSRSVVIGSAEALLDSVVPKREALAVRVEGLEDVKSILNEQGRISNLVRQCNANWTALSAVMIDFIESREQYVEKLAELTVCPICDTDLDEEMKWKVLERLT